jgi:hypothetical protein
MVVGGAVVVDRYYLHREVSAPFDAGKMKYGVLAGQWNEAVIKNDLPDRYLLSRDDDRELIEKLRVLLRPYRVKNALLTCTGKHLDGSSTLEIPIVSYGRFVLGRTKGALPDLDESLSEEVLMERVKAITGRQYVDVNMLSEVASMNAFGYYFSKNIKRFHDAGLSRNVRDISDYEKIYLDDLNCTGQ